MGLSSLINHQHLFHPILCYLTTNRTGTNQRTQNHRWKLRTQPQTELSGANIILILTKNSSFLEFTIPSFIIALIHENTFHNYVKTCDFIL